MEKIRLKTSFQVKKRLFLIKLLLGLSFVFSSPLSFAAEKELRKVENKPSATCPTEASCIEELTKNDCQDLLDDPNAPASFELGEAPTGY